jgi:hypothetical protein
MFHPANIIRLLLLLGLLTICSCATKRSTQSNANNPPSATSRETEAPKPGAETAKPQVESGALRVGEASGSYTAEGETVNLRYAYAAGRNVLAARAWSFC